MRLRLFIILPIAFLGCGIIEMLFPAEFPQRYIEREVDRAELIGTWEITTESEAIINDHIGQDQTWETIDSPWKTISLNEDGSCQIDFEITWDPDNNVLTDPASLSTCAWKMDTALGYDENGYFKDVPGIVVSFNRYDETLDKYFIDYSKNYIAEENGELVLWDFIGETPFYTQDFKKSN